MSRVLDLSTIANQQEIQFVRYDIINPQTLITNTTLKHLWLICCNHDDKILQSISHNTTLTFLNLSGNQITQCDDLAKNTSITMLHLERNNIDNSAAAFNQNTTIVRLYLHYNHISFVDYSRNTSLETLSLAHNPLQLSCIEHLNQNTTLTELGVAGSDPTNILPWNYNRRNKATKARKANIFLVWLRCLVRLRYRK